MTPADPAVTDPQATAVWSRVIARLERDPAEGLNLARECCERWADDRSRLALTVRHADERRERYTYFELAQLSQRASALFAELGLERGDRVAGVLGRGVEAWVLALAAWRSGLVYVPLFVGFGGAALAQRLSAVRVRALVFDAGRRQAVTDAIDPPGAAIEHVLVVPGSGAGDAVRAGERDFWDEVMAQPAGGPIVDTAADETAVISFTSGTTSVPKGCVVPHAGFLALMPWFDHGPRLDDRDVLFATADPGWTYGLFAGGVTAMSRGLMRVVYTGDFDAPAWLRVIDAEQVTHIATVPTALRKLVEAGTHDGVPRCLRAVTSAGEPLDAATVETWAELSDAPIRDVWGTSELGLVIANLAGDEIVPGSLASTAPGWETGLLDEQGSFIEGAGQGRVVVRRPPYQLSVGYANAPDLWAARWIHGEWYDSGDIARRDEQGRISFVGRDDDIIVTAGYNVGPAEVETVLMAHPAVLEAAAVAAPDERRRGTVVKAVVTLEPTAVPSDELTAALQQAVQDGVGRHARPRVVEYVAELPKTETGKLRRSLLRAPVEA